MLAVDRRTAELALDWCRAKWGKSRYVKGRPRLRLLKRSRQELYGWYNERINLITLRLDWHESPLDLIETVIHEYTHYLQDIAGRYDRLAEEYKDLPYEAHPLEKQAYKRQARWGTQCWAELKLMQYISNINQTK
jgi:hypothetical protein